MTPEEARRLSEFNGPNVQLMKELYSEIERAAVKGEYECFLRGRWVDAYGYYHTALKNLESEGYFVDRNYDNAGDYLGEDTIVRVSWSE